MNLRDRAPLTATGSDQAVVVERMAQLVILCKTHEVTVKANASSAGFPVPVNTMCVLGQSHGQTIYLSATAGAVIYLMDM